MRTPQGLHASLGSTRSGPTNSQRFGRLDGIIDAVERRDLIDAYWKQYALSTSGDRAARLEASNWLWAWEDVERATEDADGDVVELLIDLADAAPDTQALASLGAGPIEDLIERHGEAFADRIDEAARRHANFRTALRSVWYNDAVPRPIVERLRRFGPPL